MPIVLLPGDLAVWDGHVAIVGDVTARCGCGVGTEWRSVALSRAFRLPIA